MANIDLCFTIIWRSATTHLHLTKMYTMNIIKKKTSRKKPLINIKGFECLSPIANVNIKGIVEFWEESGNSVFLRDFTTARKYHDKYNNLQCTTQNQKMYFDHRRGYNLCIIMFVQRKYRCKSNFSIH